MSGNGEGERAKITVDEALAPLGELLSQMLGRLVAVHAGATTSMSEPLGERLERLEGRRQADRSAADARQLPEGALDQRP
jgi:hypothetical protein